MIKADLHLHTTISDGSDSTEKVVRKAVKKKLDLISITDHDIMPDLEYLKTLSKQYHIPIIPGLEVSAYEKSYKKNVHILAYNIKNYEMIHRIIRPVLKRRGENTLWQIKQLQSLGYEITEEEVRESGDGEYPYRQNIMYVLRKKNYIDDMFGSWYKNMFKNGGPCQVHLELPDPATVIKGIKAGGGKAVLAHPGQQNNYELIPELVKEGLDGIELYHPSNNSIDHEKIKVLGEKYGLFYTGGSDYHGIFSKSGKDVGECIISYDNWPKNMIEQKILDE